MNKCAVIGLLAVAALPAGCAGANGEHGVGSRQTASSPAARAEVTLLRVADPLTGIGVRPDRGWRLLGFTVGIRNTGTQPLSLSPGTAFQLMAAWRGLPAGTVSAGPCATEFAFGITIAPGKEERGCVVFQAPRNVKITRLRFSLPGGRPVSWAL